MVREPEAAITSLVRMRIREHAEGIANWEELVDDVAATTKFAVEYYVMRLGTLQALCARLEALERRGIFLRAESLLDDTDVTLRFLERALELDSPLSEEYTVFEMTGEAGSGDTSSTICSGRIVRDRPRSDDIAIPPDLLEQAREAYAGCMEALRGSPALMHVQ
jgi:hypothetical protein